MKVETDVSTKGYPVAVCENITEPAVSIKGGEFLISQATTSFLWKDTLHVFR
jgi:hypothetical protein